MKVNYFLEVITSKVYGRHPDLDNRHGVSMSQMTTDMSNCCCSRNQKPVLSLFMTYYPFVIRVTRKVTHVDQERPTLPELLRSPRFSEVCVADL